jgi:Amt family ammonium transporter
MGINQADTVWVLVSAALVMIMTPALGFFYGGLARRKNVLATIMHSFFILRSSLLQWC